MRNKTATTTYVENPEPFDLPPIPGKGYRRKSDGIIVPSVQKLGILHYKNGERLETPVKEKREDFEVVDIE